MMDADSAKYAAERSAIKRAWPRAGLPAYYSNAQRAFLTFYFCVILGYACHDAARAARR